MSHMANEPQPSFDFGQDEAVTAYSDILRGAIERIPARYRTAVFAQLADLLETPKPPRRGGPLLNNVYELYKADPSLARGATEVVEALAEKKIKADLKPVYNAINYLHGARILNRVGYGLYRMSDGSLKEGNP